MQDVTSTLINRRADMSEEWCCVIMDQTIEVHAECSRCQAGHPRFLHAKSSDMVTGLPASSSSSKRATLHFADSTSDVLQLATPWALCWTSMDTGRGVGTAFISLATWVAFTSYALTYRMFFTELLSVPRCHRPHCVMTSETPTISTAARLITRLFSVWTFTWLLHT